MAEIRDAQSVYLTPLKVMLERRPRESEHSLLQGGFIDVLKTPDVDGTAAAVVVAPLPAEVVSPLSAVVVLVESPLRIEKAEHDPMTFWIDLQTSVLRYLVLN